jgi:TrpR-related protein YerC/YecD
MQSKDLFESILLLKKPEELERFFIDIMTPAEIKAVKERWRVCQLLANNQLSYREIHQITGASLTTIGRVARFLRQEKHHGYKIILDKINNKDN